jgi:hypothetical protein
VPAVIAPAVAGEVAGAEISGTIEYGCTWKARQKTTMSFTTMINNTHVGDALALPWQEQKEHASRACPFVSLC